MQVSVGKLAKMYGVSRTALLYYDKIGLLCPAARSQAGYRLYDASDIERLGRIMVLRDAGVPLGQIGDILRSGESVLIGKLMKRLGEMNAQIEAIKTKQQYIIGILRHTFLAKKLECINPWTIEQILRSADIGEDEKAVWHKAFEKQSPEQHHDFLSLLGVSDGRDRGPRE